MWRDEELVVAKFDAGSFGESGAGREVALHDGRRDSSIPYARITFPPGSSSSSVRVHLHGVDYGDLLGSDDRVWARAQPVLESVLQSRFDRYTRDIIELRELDERQRVMKERLRRRINELIEAAQ